MADDPYRGIAERYDLFGTRFGEFDEQMVEFFRRLFERYAVHTVLDCACGTGSYLYLFHRLGVVGTGCDLSGAMIEQARTKLSQVGADTSVIQADYRHLEDAFDGRFDAVTCLSSSLLEVPSREDKLQAVKSMRSVLRDGGILVLTQGTSDKQWNEKSRFHLAVNQPDFSRLFVIDYREDGTRYNIVDIFHSKEKAGMEVWSREYPEVLLQDGYQSLLRDGGFGLVHFYGTYDLDPYDKERSDRIIAVAEA